MAGEEAWPSAEGKQRGTGDAAEAGTAAQICCPSAQMNRHLLLHPGLCQHCSDPGHHLPTLLALSKDHLTNALRAPRHPSQSHPATKLFIARCCLCIERDISTCLPPRCSPAAQNARFPSLRAPPAADPSRVHFAAGRAKAAGTHIVSRSA